MQEVIDEYTMLRRILRTPNIRILLLIMSGKNRWSDFEKVMNKRQVSEALGELIELGVIKAIEKKKGLKTYHVYEITDLGKYLLRRLDDAESKLRESLKHGV